MQLAVEQVRDGRQRVPVHGMNMSERPGNTADAQSTGYPRIFIDVTRIIIVNEVVPERLAKNKPRKHCNTDANADICPMTA